jgi:hypothetical protein
MDSGGSLATGAVTEDLTRVLIMKRILNVVPSLAHGFPPLLFDNPVKNPFLLSSMKKTPRDFAAYT